MARGARKFLLAAVIDLRQCEFPAVKRRLSQGLVLSAARRGPPKRKSR
jgi:hypothetical protein